MKIINANVYGADQVFRPGTIRITDGVIRAVSPEREALPGEGAAGDQQPRLQGADVLDAAGCLAIPGMIDLHFHGCMGADVCDGTREALERIARYELSQGVTAIAPATMTLPAGELLGVLENAAAFAADPPEGGAELVGINMEGPFISRAKKGAQDARYILPCDVALARRFLEVSGGLVKYIGVAPDENADCAAFIREMKDQVRLSLAHTNATYEQAKAAFDAGASHVVHLYNAMSPFTHRAPGVVGAASECEAADAEIICDGEHIHPAAVRAAFALFGPERMVLISDSMRATGLQDGVYTLGGQEVKVEGRRATLLSDPGALAGSVTNLPDCMRTAVREMGIPLEQAIACVTINPARSLGIAHRHGSIETGKCGNVILLRRDLSLAAVIKDGRLWNDESISAG